MYVLVISINSNTINVINNVCIGKINDYMHAYNNLIFFSNFIRANETVNVVVIG